jgi:probable F420-dependent oxidoreductase
MFGPRTICGIGRGDSAVRFTGGKPASLDVLAQCIGVIKNLAEGREVTLRGETFSIPWVKDGELDVWMAAYGPKALAVAGQTSDGLIMQLADPFIVNWAVETVNQARLEAQREANDFNVCVAAPAYVGTDLAHQRDQCRWFGGMVGNHVADIVGRYGDNPQIVPEALTEYIKGRQGYDYHHHGKVGNPDTEFVPDDVIDRFCILGPVESHRDRLTELKELGTNQFSLYLMHDNPQGTIDAYAKDIIGKI